MQEPQSTTRLNKKPFCGVQFAAASPAQAARWVCEMASSKTPNHVHLLNAYSIVMARRSREFRLAVGGSATNFPDGKPVSLLSGGAPPQLQQVRGPALFEDVMREGRILGVKHYLLGSSPETLELLQSGLKARYPGVRIVGAASPPFRPLTADERDEQDEAIRASGAEIVWVGLGTPKQDIEAARLARATTATVVAVGAAFDFSAGTKKLAPPIFGTLGLEWLFRLMSEPRRLWRRYLIGNAQFLWIVAFHRKGTFE